MDGYVNHFSKSSRILAHVKVDKLPFKFSSGQHFTLYARPKDPEDETIDLLVNCKLHQDKVASEFPITLYSWSPGMFIELVDADIENFDFYAGLQNEVEVNDEEVPGEMP